MMGNSGSIREIALFSHLVNYKDLSSQKLKQDYGEDMHPKILEVALSILNERYVSSNTRCIATLLAIKHFIYVIINDLL